jgi:hypothetical protein
MAQTPITTLPIGSPRAADYVVGIQDGLAKRFPASPSLSNYTNVIAQGADPSGVVSASSSFNAAGSLNPQGQVSVPRGAYNLTTDLTNTGETVWVLEHGASLIGSYLKVKATDYIIKFGPSGNSWVSDPLIYSGIFGYLEQNAALNVYAKEAGGIGVFAPVRSLRGTGGAAEAHIGLAGYALNDYVGGLSGVWAGYFTSLRKPGATGPTHGLEIDIANMGALVSMTPNDMAKNGQTDGIWLCTGGEASNNSAVGTASVALAIFRNDSQGAPTAKFDKGIIFHSKVIAGTDGATGTGIAIAMAKGHEQAWYNNSNQKTSYIRSEAAAAASGQGMAFTDFGLLVRGLADDGIQLQVQNVANAVNRLNVVAGPAGTPLILAVQGDINQDFVLQPAGTGNIRFGIYTAGAITQAGSILIKDQGGTLRRVLIG